MLFEVVFVYLDVGVVYVFSGFYEGEYWLVMFVVYYLMKVGIENVLDE